MARPSAARQAVREAIENDPNGNYSTPALVERILALESKAGFEPLHAKELEERANVIEAQLVLAEAEAKKKAGQ